MGLLQVFAFSFLGNSEKRWGEVWCLGMGEGNPKAVCPGFEGSLGDREQDRLEITSLGLNATTFTSVVAGDGACEGLRTRIPRLCTQSSLPCCSGGGTFCQFILPIREGWLPRVAGVAVEDLRKTQLPRKVPGRV